MEDFSRLVRFCNLQLLDEELQQAFKKADSFGKKAHYREQIWTSHSGMYFSVYYPLSACGKYGPG